MTRVIVAEKPSVARDLARIVGARARREGALTFRLIAEHARCRKPVQRLWISSLTDAAIRAGLEQLRDGHDYDALAAAARARAQADWLIGMNLTRAYTLALCDGSNRPIPDIGVLLPGVCSCGNSRHSLEPLMTPTVLRRPRASGFAWSIGRT